MALPGVALADEARPVTAITGAKPGPVLFVGTEVPGGDYPTLETVSHLDTELNSAEIAGTDALLSALNPPAFYQRGVLPARLVRLTRGQGEPESGLPR